MLCNRPFAGSVANTKPQGATTPQFSCGVVSASIGQNVPISLKEKMVKRPKKDSVLVKHKKWLADLQKTKERLEQEYLDEARRKEEEKMRFQEHERKMRELQRTIMYSSDSKDPASDTMSDSKASGSAKPEDSKDSISSKATGKPAWAVTEEAAEKLSEAKQAKEEDELLNFALGLNFDRYIGDMEVQMTVERLRRRIAELEREVKEEESRELDAEARAARREMLEMMGAAEASLQQQPSPSDAAAMEQLRALQTAKALLGEEDSLQNVHSTKSVVTLLRAAKDKIGQVRDQVKALQPGTPAEPKVNNEVRRSQPFSGTLALPLTRCSRSLAS